MPKVNEGVVGDRVARNFQFLFKLSETKNPEARWNMLQRATKDELLAIVDICANIVHKDFKLTSSQSRRLEKYWDCMKSISRVRSPRGALRTIQKGEGIVYDRRAQKYVIQSGGFAPLALLPAVVIPILVELAVSGAKHLLSKK